MEGGRGPGGDEMLKINVDGNSLESPQPTEQSAVRIQD